MDRLRVAYLHVGTHKTGTTSIQALLAANEDAFARAGVLVPKTGRTNPAFAGHHNIAWELYGNVRFDSAQGTTAELLREIAAAGAPSVCLSSEEFELTDRASAALAPLCDGLRALGYTIRVVLYLRPQADYIESLYAELVSGGWDFHFPAFLREIMTKGIFGCSHFDYERLIAQFVALAGDENVIVRPYRSHAPNDLLLRDFTSVVAAATCLRFDALAQPARLNPMTGFEEIRLDIVGIAAVVARFARSNARIRRSRGVGVGCASWPTVAREVLVALAGDAESYRHKRAILGTVGSAARRKDSTAVSGGTVTA